MVFHGLKSHFHHQGTKGTKKIIFSFSLSWCLGVLVVDLQVDQSLTKLIG
jgi:hypothetical protein